jgi:hypothetical protein
VEEDEEEDAGPYIGGYRDLEEFDLRLKQADLQSAGMRFGRLQDWTPQQVAEAAERVGLGRFSEVIVAGGLDGRVVQLITEEDLRQGLGITAFGDVKRLMLFFVELRTSCR